MKTILFVSNGHGEDLNSSTVLAALRDRRPDWHLLAAPLVGEGQAYRKLAVPVITPTHKMPSGGFIYMDNRQLWQDLRAGLLNQTWQQWQTLRRQKVDGVVAVGDTVAIAGALLTGAPFVSFLVSLSARYTGRLHLPFPVLSQQRHRRCRLILARDAFTAKLLQARGYPAEFAGYPILDLLQVERATLEKTPDRPLVALLPGSRLPEAAHNFALLLQMVTQVPSPMVFWAALVPGLESYLPAVAPDWHWDGKTLRRERHEIHCPPQAFAEILTRCDAVVGMAGTAIEQAVGLGKPVLQIPGAGPQFTYRFAEAQMRLLGPSVQTVGTGPATPETLTLAAQRLVQILGDRDYLARCPAWGIESVGTPGGTQRIVNRLLDVL
ncbi:MAG: lipid-A-disaccharide synthase-related protein [Pseudanabaenaceae cyanobacterium]